MWGAVGEVKEKKKDKQAVTGLVFLVHGTAEPGHPLPAHLKEREKSMVGETWWVTYTDQRKGGTRQGKVAGRWQVGHC